MVVEVRDENLIRARIQGHAIQITAQATHTNHRRRVQHAQDGTIHGHHLHTMLVSDHQGPSSCHRHGPGAGELPRLRAFRTQVPPHGASAQAPQGQPMIIQIGNYDNGNVL